MGNWVSGVISIKKPVILYETFEVFVEYIKRMGHKDREWPCFRCEGYGRIIDPDYQPDVIEGYKLANRIKCPNCGGAGEQEGGEERYIDTYFQTCVRHTRNMEQYEKEMTVLLSIQKKLTAEEAKLLHLPAITEK